jgi:hypothetical protein
MKSLLMKRSLTKLIYFKVVNQDLLKLYDRIVVYTKMYLRGMFFSYMVLIKELAGRVQVDMTQNAEIGGCFGLDDVSQILFFATLVDF